MIKTKTKEELASLCLPTFDDLAQESKRLDDKIKVIDDKIAYEKKRAVTFFDYIEIDNLLEARASLVEKQEALQYKYDLMSKAYLEGAACEKHSDPTTQNENSSPEEETNHISISEDVKESIKNARTLNELKLAIMSAFE